MNEAFRTALHASLVAAFLLASTARADEIFLVPGAPSRVTCGLAGTGWQAPELDDRLWTGPPDGGTGGSGLCAQTRYERWHFRATNPSALASLALKLRYQHGFAAYLNGVEIARRRLEAQATSQSFATEVHGLLPETITLPLSNGLLRDGDNVLAIEVHTTKNGKEPVLDVELVGRQGARLLRGPYLQNLDQDSVDVLVDTDLPTEGTLTVFNDGAPRELRSASGKRHRFHVGELAPATRYSYELVLIDALQNRVEVPRFTFHTAPQSGKPVRFVVYGDVRSGHDVHGALNRAILDEDPDFVLMTGDLVAAGSDDGDWERYFAVAQTLIGSVCVYPAPGNHEYARLGRGRQKFLDYFRVGSFVGNGKQAPTGAMSFEIAGLRFLAIDSNEYKNAAHLAWIAAELDAAKKKKQPIFVFSHEGPFSTGLHGDNSIAVGQYVPLFERAGVAMMMYGHDHHYERGRVGKLNYVVSGGGGAELRVGHCGPGRICPARVLGYANEHHYVLVEVVGKTFRVCPKRPDGSAIEACSVYPLRP